MNKTATTVSFTWSKQFLTQPFPNIASVYNLTSTELPQYDPILTLTETTDKDDLGTAYIIQNFITQKQTYTTAHNIDDAKKFALEALSHSIKQLMYRYINLNRLLETTLDK